MSDKEPMEPSSLPPVVRFLIEAAAGAPSADNSQPWTFAWDGQRLEARASGRGGLPSEHHASRLAFGAAAENLAQALSLVGEADGWSFGVPDERGVFASGPVRAPHAAVPTGDLLPWQRRRTSRAAYRLEPVPAECASAVAAMQVGRCSCRVVTGRDKLREVAAVVQGASEIRFQTREVHEWLGRSLRYGPGEAGLREGLHVRTLAVPPGVPTILKWTSRWEVMERLNRVGAHRLFAAVEAATFTQAPCVLAVVGPETVGPDTAGPGAAADALDAGRLFERAWLHLAAQGLAGHPFYVLPDLFMRLESGGVPPALRERARTVVEDAREVLGLENQKLHCLIRFGVPKKETPRSLRRTVEDLLGNDTAPVARPAARPAEPARSPSPQAIAVHS